MNESQTKEAAAAVSDSAVSVGAQNNTTALTGTDDFLEPNPAPVSEPPVFEPSTTTADYAKRARLAGVGVGLTGIVTFAFFSVASQVLDKVDYKCIAVLWSVMFVIATVIYRPIEQLLTRTIASRRAQGLEHSHPYRTAVLVQSAFATAFFVTALLFRDQLQQELFEGSTTLYWVFVGGIITYAVSYFARGWLAGNQHPGLYGGLMLMESCVRITFPIAAAIGIAQGQSFVALGIAAAPLLSLIVLPSVFLRHTRKNNHQNTPPLDRPSNTKTTPPRPSGTKSPSPSNSTSGAKFAFGAFAILLAEQVLLNAAILTTNATATNKALAGFVFNALLIARAPLQLFQAIQGSLLPHLSQLHILGNYHDFHNAVKKTLITVATFAVTASLALLLIGPKAMAILFGSHFEYSRFGLVLVGLGMGAHLLAGTLNQAALACNKVILTVLAWSLTAVIFIAWLLLIPINNQLLRAEAGYLAAALSLLIALAVIYRMKIPRRSAIVSSIDTDTTISARS